MKRVLFILFLFSCQNHPISFEWAKGNPPTHFDAMNAKKDRYRNIPNKNAIQDFNKGIQEYTFEGTMYATEFNLFYDKYMLEKYNIVIKSTCTPSFSRNEYYVTMNELVLEKYGDYFIHKTRESARKEFRKMGKDPDADN